LLIVIIGILAFILPSHIYQISKGLLPLLPGFQTTKAHYLFGTLETANGSIFNTLGLSYADVAKKEHDAGIAVAQITIAWKDFETHALQQLNVQVGLTNIWDFRVDGGDGGEANYGPSDDGQGHTNSYWAYDGNAQGTENNLPLGVSKTPFPGWQPGQMTYNDRPFTTSQAQQWYDWYFHSRMNYYNWQVALYRNAGFSNYLTFATPGFGTRPDEYTT